MNHLVLNLGLFYHEQTVIFRTLGGYHGAGLTTERERRVIRSLGEEVDEDEAYVSRLFETSHIPEESKIRKRQYLVLISWFLWGTTAGAWEGWNAAYIWNEVKDRIGAHRSGECCNRSKVISICRMIYSCTSGHSGKPLPLEMYSG